MRTQLGLTGRTSRRRAPWGCWSQWMSSLAVLRNWLSRSGRFTWWISCTSRRHVSSSALLIRWQMMRRMRRMRLLSSSVQQLLQTLKPRIVTVEETFGLLRHFQHLSALVNIFVSVGYSVRWKICNLANWGVPQQRKRLLFIAAGPGETLPPFPKATHGGGLRKPATIQDTLDTIPDCATRQEVSAGGVWPKILLLG